MKIKLPNDLLIIDILSVILVLSITLIPAAIMRIVLGLPFLLFFPGYVLTAALFPRNEMDNIERLALSFGLSIATTILIGLGLNYTFWGIRLEPVLFVIAFFIVFLSLIAILRRRNYGRKELVSITNLNVSAILEGSPLIKVVNIILILAIIGGVGTLIYINTAPKKSEKFTDFYILGTNGLASNYPTVFMLSPNLKVMSVQYGDDTMPIAESYGLVTVGIINQEQQNTSYSLSVYIGGTPVDIPFQDGNVNNIGPIVLAPEGQWQQEIGILPQHTGSNQEVDLFLYKDGVTQPYLDLHFWITVTQQ